MPARFQDVPSLWSGSRNAASPPAAELPVVADDTKLLLGMAPGALFRRLSWAEPCRRHQPQCASRVRARSVPALAFK